MFINLLTGGNGGGGSTTAGVNSLNGQKGDLKLKTVNNNDLLGEGNIEIQAGVTSVNGQEGAVVIDVPTKVSQLENDANYASQSEIPTTTSELTNNSGYITIADVPTKVSQLENDSNYATQSEIPTKVSQLQNDANYATQSELPTTTSELTNNSGFITIADVPTKVSELTNDSGYITNANIPTKVSELTNDKEYQTKKEVNDAIAIAITGGTGSGGGMEPVFINELSETERKEFLDYIITNIDVNNNYKGAKWPWYLTNIGRQSIPASDIFYQTGTTSYYASFRFPEVSGGKFTEYTFKSDGTKTGAYKPLGSYANSGVIFLKQNGTLNLDETDKERRLSVEIPFVANMSFTDAMKNYFPCFINLDDPVRPIRSTTIPVRIQSPKNSGRYTIFFELQGMEYQYTMTADSYGAIVAFVSKTPLPNINSSEVSNIKVLTQAEYDAIDPKDAKTLYMIKG